MDIKQLTAPVSPRRIGYGWGDLRGDVTGGAVASSLLIPAALGYGALSGLGPLAGLYGALALGVFGAIIGNTKGIISGPNPNVTIIFAAVVSQYATNITDALITAILAGIIQIGFGLLRLGRYISYVPSSLMQGFFVGVGILIIVLQLMPALGLPPAGSGLIGTVAALPAALADLNTDAAMITVVCLAVAVAWRGRIGRVVPAHLVMLVAGTLLSVFWLSDAPVIGGVSAGLPELRVPQLQPERLLHIIQPAFMIALLSSTGLLISTTLVDSITGRQHNPNQLIIGHGLGNMAAGLVGGLPGSASNGTLANAFSGGRTRVSNLTVTLIVLLTLVSGLGQAIALVPHAVLASILITTGFSIINWRQLGHIHRVPRIFATVLLLTAFLVLFVDIIVGLVIGFVVATLGNAPELEDYEIRRLISVPLLDQEILGKTADLDDPFQAHTGLVVFPDRISVASARELVRIVGRDVGGHQMVIFDLSRTEYVDSTAAMMLGQLINSTTSRGTRDFVISGLSENVAERFNSLNLLNRVPAENFAANLDEAKQIVRPMLEADLGGDRPTATREPPAQ